MVRLSDCDKFVGWPIRARQCSAGNVGDVWSLVCLELTLTFPQHEFDGSKVFSVDVNVLLELASGKALEVGTSVRWLLSSSSEALAVEGEDVALESRKAGHCEYRGAGDIR